MMQPFPPTIVLRHCRENLKKCSLRGLESRDDFLFFSYPNDTLPDFSGYVMLTLDAPILDAKDCQKGLFLIDATWRYAEKMIKSVDSKAKIEKRSLPSIYRTAYPRRQEDCPDPEKGLASIEALYLSYRILGREAESLLEGYYWKGLFFEKNPSLRISLDLTGKFLL